MKKKMILIVFFSVTVLFAGFNSSVEAIGPQIKKRMIEGKSWRKGCPVKLEDLRYIRVSYWDFKGKIRSGELIMHRDVSRDIVEVFEELYNLRYPVRKMQLVSDFKGNDWQSIEAGNSSAFNCRSATGSKKWSKHAYGRAIDINPIENPYISKSGHISHKASLKYRKRAHRNLSDPGDRAVLLKNDKATQIFKKNGWKWGGDWPGIKDYQHFSK
ncbi:MAG: M15 family metallopeptidase [Campylobacterota bacterium]|nr:M15 family metallopeptidase [Campylobacterota bacterium]